MTTTQKIQAVVAAIVLVGFFGMMGALLTMEIPEGNVRVLDVLLGALAGSVLTIVSYWFGSSLGSKLKTDGQQKLIDQITDKISGN